MRDCKMCAVEKERKRAHHVQNQHMVSLKTRCPTAICLHAGYTHTHTPSQTRHASGDLISYSHTDTLCKCAQSCLWFQDSFAHTFKYTHICLIFFFSARAQGSEKAVPWHFVILNDPSSDLIRDPFSFEALGRQKERQHCKNTLSNMTLNSNYTIQSLWVSAGMWKWATFNMHSSAFAS